MFRMLAIDVDGTLIGRDRHVSPRVRAAVRGALEALALTADPLQLVAADDAARADPLIADLARGPWRTVTSMSTLVPDARFVEVLSPACSKTNAIRRLAERYGVGMDEVLAVGDN